MKIVFVGGGTAGHVYPALAVAQHLLKNYKNVEVLYVGSESGMERRLVENSGLRFKGITTSGFSRKISFDSLKKNLVTLKNIFVSARQSREIIRGFKPDVCFATGGYVCGVFVRTASRMGVPCFIHEQNAYPGLTTKLLAKHARKILLGSRLAQDKLKYKEKTVFTGNPVRETFDKVDISMAKKKLRLDENLPTILSFGGSLGARKINEVMADFILKNRGKFNFIHAFGRGQAHFLEYLKRQGLECQNLPNMNFFEYIENMPECLAASDLVVSRAGAVTLAEISYCKKPSVLIPSPNVAENHQFHNAMELVNFGVAEIIEEKNLSVETLSQKVDKILKSREIQKNFERLPKNAATTRIAGILMDS